MAASEPRIIRKYANRRLYDAESSRHVRLAEVREMIAGGRDIKVIDDVSGEDITRSVLVQLVAEQEIGGRPVLSDELLVQIIRFYGHPIQGVLGAYLQQGLEAFSGQQRALQASMQKLAEGSPFGALEELTARNLEAWRSFRDGVMGKSPKSAPDEE